MAGKNSDSMKPFFSLLRSLFIISMLSQHVPTRPGRAPTLPMFWSSRSRSRSRCLTVASIPSPRGQVTHSCALGLQGNPSLYWALLNPEQGRARRGWWLSRHRLLVSFFPFKDKAVSTAAWSQVKAVTSLPCDCHYIGDKASKPACQKTCHYCECASSRAACTTRIPPTLRRRTVLAAHGVHIVSIVRMRSSQSDLQGQRALHENTLTDTSSTEPFFKHISARPWCLKRAILKADNYFAVHLRTQSQPISVLCAGMNGILIWAGRSHNKERGSDFKQGGIQGLGRGNAW